LAKRALTLWPYCSNLGEDEAPEATASTPSDPAMSPEEVVK